MLLTITYEGKNTQDLGFLLYKNPARAQSFDLSFGMAHVFYPEVSDLRTTAALLLEIDPLDLTKGKVGSREGGLFDYVNDRPYASTSFMSTAMIRVFGTAMNGKCSERQELADTPLDLTARLVSLKDNGEKELARQMFEPLGYEVATRRVLLDECFPEWGDSPYIDLTIRGRIRLSELLNHLYVLIPVFDTQKHYFTSEEEIKKLLSHGEGWLETHPYMEKITNRFLKAQRSYARKAIEILLEKDGELLDKDEGILAKDEETIAKAEETLAKDEEILAKTEETLAKTGGIPGKDGEILGRNGELPRTNSEPRTPLNLQRLTAVKQAVLDSGASSVIDLGCGEGRLTGLLLAEPQLRKVAACDVAVSELEKAAKRLKNIPSVQKDKLTLFQASLTYRDKRFEGYDCALVIEVIEHIDPLRLPALERSVFAFAAPRTVILTTPNREYNENYEHLSNSELRHTDHRFEWTREEFAAFAENICQKYGYKCVIRGIGEADERFGAPTQMGVFTKNGNV